MTLPMLVWMRVGVLTIIFCLVLPLTVMPHQQPIRSPLPELNAKIRRFAPTVITADTSRLSGGDRRALAKIIEAARIFDPLFLRQVWSGNLAVKKRLEANQGHPLWRARLHYFLINDGPWSQLDENRAFIE